MGSSLVRKRVDRLAVVASEVKECIIMFVILSLKGFVIITSNTQGPNVQVSQLLYSSSISLPSTSSNPSRPHLSSAKN
jgi:hypothetical protein